MAAWVKEEEKASENRRRKREADKIEVARGVGVVSLRCFRAASIGLLRPVCVLGLILVGRSDLMGFHCVIRMVTQGIGFCRSRSLLIKSGWVTELRGVTENDHVDQCLTSQCLKKLV